MRIWRSWFVAVSIVAAPAAIWIGCNDSIGGTITGQLGAACFANGTCNLGLDCVANECVAGVDAASVDGSVASGADATPGDSGEVDAGIAPKDASFDGSYVDCGALPALSEAGAGPFCPFQTIDGGSVSSSCGMGEQCCTYQGASPSPASTCNAADAGCAPHASYVTVDWECDTASQCPASNVCCMTGVDGGMTHVASDNACPSGALLTAVTVGGTHCAAACAAGEVKLCGNDADCPMGTKCAAFSTNAKTLGVCR